MPAAAHLHTALHAGLHRPLSCGQQRQSQRDRSPGPLLPSLNPRPGPVAVGFSVLTEKDPPFPGRAGVVQIWPQPGSLPSAAAVPWSSVGRRVGCLAVGLGDVEAWAFGLLLRVRRGIQQAGGNLTKLSCSGLDAASSVGWMPGGLRCLHNMCLCLAFLCQTLIHTWAQ